MSKPSSHQDLAGIVRQGASRPLRKWFIIIVLAALVGSGLWYGVGSGKGDGLKPGYVTDPVKKGRISLVVTAAGNLAPTNQIVIGSELSGTVQDVRVDTNDQVKKGQELARLDPSKLNQQTERSRAALLVAKAKVSQAEATLAENKAALLRQQELHKLSDGKTPSVATMETSRATVQRSMADLESAKASVAGAEAEVRAFERDLEKSIIRSPVDGVVLVRSVEVGQTVAASFTAPTLFTIAEDLRKMDLVVSVSEADIGRVAAGQDATFTVDAWPSRSYSAKVKKVAFGSANNQNAGGGNNNNNSAAAGGVVTYSTELEVANDDLSLRPGMTATVDISIVDKKDIIVVPNAALRFDPEMAAAVGASDGEGKRTLVQSLTPFGGRRWRGPPAPKPGSVSTEPRVWVLKDGNPEMIKVAPGITNGRITEITGDTLPEGTPVVISIEPAKSE